MPRHFKDKYIASKRARHILWLINNVPDHPVLAEPEAQIQNIDEDYATAKTLLLAKLEQDPDNIQLVWNVALSVLVEDGARSEQLLRHGQKLKPNGPAWPLMLSVIYGIRAKYGEKEQKAEGKPCERQAKKLCSELRNGRASAGRDSEAWYL
jgi:predicted Zn-dependent protease